MRTNQISALGFFYPKYNHEIHEPVLPDNFKVVNYFADNNKRCIKYDNVYKNNQHFGDSKKLLLGLSAFVLSAGILLIAGKNKIKAFSQITKLKRVAKKSAQNFPQDFLYKKRIASILGISGSEYKLNSIAGAEELKYITQKFADTPEIFSPGKKIFSKTVSVLQFDETNVRNFKFGVNLHMHTNNSDGKLSVKELLDSTAKYANSYYEKNKRPFYCAITDHDTVEGCRQALKIVSQNPEKYKNLRLFLGSELTVTYNNPELLSQKAKIHVLLYGLNPFDKQIGLFIDTRIQNNKNVIQNAISEANKLFSSELSNQHFQYNFDEMLKLAPSIGVGIKDATYYFKDYLQFKLLYASMVENNLGLKNLGLMLNEIDYTKPLDFIPKDLDYSKGQKYYEYYYEALKQCITKHLQDKNPKLDISEIQKAFPEINTKLHQTLTDIESKALNPNSPLYVAPNNLPDITYAMEKLSEFSDGKMSLAHPGVFFPMNAIKDKNKLPQMYEQIYQIFKNSGKGNAMFSEDFYQSHYNTDNSFTRAILENISKKYSLLKTGGLDTHGKNIFSV